jgi:hypothetical protein
MAGFLMYHPARPTKVQPSGNPDWPSGNLFKNYGEFAFPGHSGLVLRSAVTSHDACGNIGKPLRGTLA